MPVTVNTLTLDWIATGHVAPVPLGETLEIQEPFPPRTIKVSHRSFDRRLCQHRLLLQVVHRDGSPNTAVTNFLSGAVEFFEGLGHKNNT